MGNVVYVPPRADAGTAFGTGVSQAIFKHLDRQIEKEKAQRLQKLLGNLLTAKDETQLGTAYAMIVNSDAVEDRQDIAAITKIYENQKDRFTPVRVDAVDAENRPVEKFIPKSELGKIGTKDESSVLGLGFRSGKPEPEVEMFMPPQRGFPGEPDETDHRSIGKKAESKRPRGAITKSELELVQSKETQKREDTRIDLATQAAMRAEEAAARAEAREIRLANQERAGTTERNRDNIRQEMNAARAYALTVVGDKLEDGTWGLTNENQRKRYQQILNEARVHITGGKDHLEAVNLGSEKYPSAAVNPKPPPVATKDIPKSEPGLFQRMFGKKDETEEDKIKRMSISAWGSYEPTKYLYRVNNGKLQRATK